ncbi:hypothetical protein GCM10029964_067440 [Kibdelosporangium lantanae]
MSGGSRVMEGLLAPGTVVGDGRYRLLDPVGVDERDNAQLWQARDGQLNRDVALTIVPGRSADALRRTAPTSRLAHPGISPVLNVSSGDDGVGLIAAEWTRGTGMADVVAPVTPVHACLLLEPLADAVGRAHRRGLVLGVGHPLRIRVTPAGTLRLAFPGPPAGLDPIDDVRGLGALLYFLLTANWPTPGTPLPAPRELQPEVPVELSEVAVRSLADSPGAIRTSDSILRVLRQVPVIAAQPVPEDDEHDDDGPVWITKPPVNDSSRKKKLTVAVAALVLVTIAVIAWIVVTLIGTFL